MMPAPVPTDATGQQAIESIIAAVELLRVGVWLHTDQALFNQSQVSSSQSRRLRWVSSQHS
jgi:hypothetical protein